MTLSFSTCVTAGDNLQDELTPVDLRPVAVGLLPELADRQAPGLPGILGQASAGRFLRVVYVPDGRPGAILVITAYELGPKGLASITPQA